MRLKATESQLLALKQRLALKTDHLRGKATVIVTKGSRSALIKGRNGNECVVPVSEAHSLMYGGRA